MARRDTAPRFDNDIALPVLDVERGDFPPQAFRLEVHRKPVLFDVKDVLVEEHVEDVFAGILECPQDDGGRQLAAPVDADEDAVFGVEFEVEPGAAIGR